MSDPLSLTLSDAEDLSPERLAGDDGAEQKRCMRTSPTVITHTHAHTHVEPYGRDLRAILQCHRERRLAHPHT